MPHHEGLIYDWNIRKRHHPLTDGSVTLYDETLRDGIQGPSIVDPPIADKLRLLELADAVGIDAIDLGLPGAGPRARADVLALARHLADHKLAIRPSCAARTHLDDIRPVVEVSQATGVELEVMAFLGTSPIRRLVEGWSLDRLLELTIRAVDFAVKEGLPVTFVTEDTTRSRPADLEPLFRAAIDHGAHRLALCDTVGHATPDGVRNLIDFTRDVIEVSGAKVGIDWHGHNDRGLALTNSLTALESGADRIHGTALGIGERVGNAPLDQILVNLRLLGERDTDLSRLPEWCETVSRAVGRPIPGEYPVLGGDAFRTATGVHAAAVIKAEASGDPWLADTVYSGVPAGLVGRAQRIEIGPMSGLSNVRHWLAAHGHPAGDALCDAIFRVAKAADRVLPDALVEDLVASHLGDDPGAREGETHG